MRPLPLLLSLAPVVVLSLQACRPPSIDPGSDGGPTVGDGGHDAGTDPCAQFEGVVFNPLDIRKVASRQVQLYASAPEMVFADSASYTLTDPNAPVNETGTVTSGPVQVLVSAQDPGPWTGTVVYQKVGCADRTLGPVTTTLDFTPTGPVTGLTATPGTYSATLSWTNPSDSDFTGVQIVMKVGSAPLAVDDPAAVPLCSDTAGTKPCGKISYTATGVPAGNVFFAVYALDSFTAPNYSTAAVTNATVPGISHWSWVAACTYGSYGIAADGSLWEWGSQYVGLTPAVHGTGLAPEHVGSATWRKVACGTYQGIGILTDGTLMGWGGSPGNGLGTAETGIPTQIGTNFTEVAAGPSHSLAVRSDGTLWAWGANDHGQLGDGTQMPRNVPTQVGTDTDWKSVAGGETHSLALKTNGTLWAFGGNVNGELGDGSRTSKFAPERIGSATDWTQIAAGYSASVGLRAGTLWGWGYPLVNGTSNMDVLTPTQIGTAGDWVAISVSYINALGIRADTSLWGWGNQSISPTQINPSGWSVVAPGHFHWMAIRTDGSRWAWGDNRRGELGDGTTTSQTAPTLMP